MVAASSLTALRAMSAARSAGPSTIAAASRFISTSSPVAAKKKTKAKVPVKVQNPDALPVDEAIRILRALEVANPASAFSLEVLATPKPGSSFRGRVSLPIDPRKEADTIVVFVEQDTPAAKAALEAGAHYAGNEDLYPKILSGEIVPTKCLATSGVLPSVTRNLARFLGPKGLMPAAKRGTVADGDELGELVRNMAGTVEWKTDKWGYIRAPVARMSFGAPSISENVRAFVDSIKEASFNATSMDSAHTRVSRSAGIIHVRLETTHGPSIELNDVL
ncbi:50S ribosomal protein L1 [Vanrija pseudolonga]|uniref:50S ribosomal protein L1 n=1 Tax=Vanrija pseudolonga TaxID=143232 RepID=A0AAF0Y8K0_9TREE|nr:50S ribosomal protein L1 [Vanrija pseudolonga]